MPRYNPVNMLSFVNLCRYNIIHLMYRPMANARLRKSANIKGYNITGKSVNSTFIRLACTNFISRTSSSAWLYSESDSASIYAAGGSRSIHRTNRTGFWCIESLPPFPFLHRHRQQLCRPYLEILSLILPIFSSEEQSSNPRRSRQMTRGQIGLSKPYCIL